jgi:hypothetical protein
MQRASFLLGLRPRVRLQTLPQPNEMSKKSAAKERPKPLFPPTIQEPYSILISDLVRSEGPHFVISKSLPNRHSQQALPTSTPNRHSKYVFAMGILDSRQGHYALREQPCSPQRDSKTLGGP